MVEEEGGIIDGRVKVRRIAAHGVVTRCVKPKEAVWVPTLDLGPEQTMRLSTRTDGHVQQVGRREPLLWDVGAEIPAQAAGVGLGNVGRQVSEALHAGGDWTNVRLRTVTC